MTTANHLGKESFLRLRAENLLEYADKGDIAVSDDERAVLDRITVAPRLDDNEFLGGFDVRLEERWPDDE